MPDPCNWYGPPESLCCTPCNSFVNSKTDFSDDFSGTLADAGWSTIGSNVSTSGGRVVLGVTNGNPGALENNHRCNESGDGPLEITISSDLNKGGAGPALSNGQYEYGFGIKTGSRLILWTIKHDYVPMVTPLTQRWGVVASYSPDGNTPTSTTLVAQTTSPPTGGWDGSIEITETGADTEIYTIDWYVGTSKLHTETLDASGLGDEFLDLANFPCEIPIGYFTPGYDTLEAISAGKERFSASDWAVTISCD